MRTTRESGCELFVLKVAINPGGDCAGAADDVVATANMTARNQRRLIMHPNVPRASCPCLVGKCPTAFLIFPAASTGTRIIASYFFDRSLFPRQHLHDQRCRLLVPQQVGHGLHVWVDVVE